VKYIPTPASRSSHKMQFSGDMKGNFWSLSPKHGTLYDKPSGVALHVNRVHINTKKLKTDYNEDLVKVKIFWSEDKEVKSFTIASLCHKNLLHSKVNLWFGPSDDVIFQVTGAEVPVVLMGVVFSEEAEDKQSTEQEFDVYDDIMKQMKMGDYDEFVSDESEESLSAEKLAGIADRAKKTEELDRMYEEQMVSEIKASLALNKKVLNKEEILSSHMKRCSTPMYQELYRVAKDPRHPADMVSPDDEDGFKRAMKQHSKNEKFLRRFKGQANSSSSSNTSSTSSLSEADQTSIAVRAARFYEKQERRAMGSTRVKKIERRTNPNRPSVEAAKDFLRGENLRNLRY